MARVIMPLCAERHYMGSTSNGRFSTDRSVRPDYDRRPDAQTLARWDAAHDAQLTRYLREQNVVGLVLACQDARDDLAAAQARLADVEAALEAARATEPGSISETARTTGSAGTSASDDAPKQAATPRDDRIAQLTEARTWLQHRLDEALQNRRSASQRLRLIGISPKQEALIRAEIQRRSEQAAPRPASAGSAPATATAQPPSPVRA